MLRTLIRPQIQGYCWLGWDPWICSHSYKAQIESMDISIYCTCKVSIITPYARAQWSCVYPRLSCLQGPHPSLWWLRQSPVWTRRAYGMSGRTPYSWGDPHNWREPKHHNPLSQPYHWNAVQMKPTNCPLLAAIPFPSQMSSTTTPPFKCLRVLCLMRSWMSCRQIRYFLTTFNDYMRSIQIQ